VVSRFDCSKDLRVPESLGGIGMMESESTPLCKLQLGDTLLVIGGSLSILLSKQLLQYLSIRSKSESEPVPEEMFPQPSLLLFGIGSSLTAQPTEGRVRGPHATGRAI
jgi:hypothetical protein